MGTNKRSLNFRNLLTLIITLFLLTCGTSSCSDEATDPLKGCKVIRAKFGGTERDFTYDDRGLLIEISITNYTNAKSKLVYDDDGRIVKHVQLDNDEETSFQRFVYNDDNNISNVTNHQASGGLTSIATYEYDDLHRMIQYKLRSAGASNFISHMEFSYYENGNLKETTFYHDGVEEYSVDHMDYDDKINPATLHPFFQFLAMNYSTNNVGRQVDLYGERRFTYAYNAKNLPTSIDYRITSTGDGETTMPMYTCD